MLRIQRNAVERAGQRLWWVLVIVGMLYIAIAVLDVFDPSDATQNPYNKLELYAEMPVPETLQNLLGILLGVLGLLAVCALEYAGSQESRYRPFTSPARLWLYVLVSVGYLLETLTRLHAFELLPDMAHYYYALESPGHHVPALVTEFMVLDVNRFFLFLGGGLWVLALSLDFRRSHGLHPVLLLLGMLYGLSTIVLLLLMLADIGFFALIMTFVGTGFLAPIWFIAMAFHMRRRNRVQMPRS
jgi:hypothetical protein